VKILLVEDSRSNGLENRRALVEAGYEVMWAEGESARCGLLANRRRPDSCWIYCCRKSESSTVSKEPWSVYRQVSGNL